MKPLTPPDCDLQDFPFMPLHVARLRDSDLASEESPEACWYAVLLWAASWHQIPAGSLPDNEAVLTKLIGLGRDLKTFRRHKAGALRGFVLCDDGRLYHEVVSEQALVAWESKLQQRWRTECSRIKKANQRNSTAHPLPTWEEFQAALPSTSRLRGQWGHVPGDNKDESLGTWGACPQGKAVQETETGTETGNQEEDADASFAERPIRPKADAALVESLWACQPVCGGKRKATRPEVAKALDAALKRGHDPAKIEAAFRAYYALPDCTRDGGQFAKGAAVLLHDDKWRDFEPANAARLGDDWPESRWRIAANLYVTEQTWDDRLGPRLGEPGCRVSPEIQREFGVEPAKPQPVGRVA